MSALRNYHHHIWVRFRSSASSLLLHTHVTSIVTTGAVLQDPGFERDGRRPQGWRDELENTIAGEWVWEQGEIAGVKPGKIGVAMGTGTGQQTIYNPGKGSKASRSAGPAHPGVGITQGVTVDDQYLRVTNEIPETRTIAHVPGE